jgi:hypothetical protein
MLYMRSFFITLSLLFFFNSLTAQTYFEGEVIYRSEIFKKVSGKTFPGTTQPASYIKESFKNGNWLQQPDGGIIEYMQFDTLTNKIYWKLRNSDTLFFEDGRYRRAAENDPGMKYRIVLNTDTLLGMVCNSLIIQTKALELTLVYCPTLQVDPAWYSKTKIGFYDLIYSKTKSICLKSVITTRQSVSVSTATEIYYVEVEDTVFPDVHNALLQKLF